jgi:hypothetical protein
LVIYTWLLRLLEAIGCPKLTRICIVTGKVLQGGWQGNEAVVAVKGRAEGQTR